MVIVFLFAPLGVVHNAVDRADLEADFDKFVTIPSERKLSDRQNADLMQEITAEEVIRAIDALNRNKAAGGDGLNNDFFKDMQVVLVPAMVAIGNELLNGADPPTSFLEGLIIPLRKKGDSRDAMDFRPISLLQTGYKVYTKVIATRAQKVLGTPIGDSQQGFVHGRQMMKTVMMMLAILATAKQEPELAAALSQVILLLDFRKAYDTVAREFLFLALLKFGFSVKFVTMIRKLHDGTTARFLVNGELSWPQEVKSGIRQGCPLAPLLFILAAEVLALAIQQDKETQGIEIPGGLGKRHKFSAFVDDSTVFLEQAQQLPRVMEIVAQFGRLSGLQVQPTKSHLIFLNKAIKFENYNGIPVVSTGDTVRYLGYKVGTGALTDVNWAERIRSLQRRLATATQLATSVDNRVTLLNVILLPSVLFTAAVFELPKWANQQIGNMQKQFLWRSSTDTEASKHKMNPGLVFAPRNAGGLGLTSILLACKTQRVKHAMQWLIQRHDKYFWAWRAWMFRGISGTCESGISPRASLSRGLNARLRAPGQVLQQLLGEWIQPAEESSAAEIQLYQHTLEDFELKTVSWTVKNEWFLELPHQLPVAKLEMDAEVQRFWPTFKWCSNPSIVDKKGRMLGLDKYARIMDCSITELQIQRTGNLTYTFRVQWNGDQRYQEAKLRRWGLAILLNSPRLVQGEHLQVKQELQLRHPTALQHNYSWKCTGQGKVTGEVINGRRDPADTIELEQAGDGIHWIIGDKERSRTNTNADRRKLERHQTLGSIVFYAHPRIHRFPWRVPESIGNKHVALALQRQPFKRYRGADGALDRVLDGLQEKVETGGWQYEVMQQTPKQVWAHRHELTEYQVWVSYRVAIRQLNLYHEGRQHDNSCRKLKECGQTKETIEHIFWECPCAKECWRKLIAHWTGEQWTAEQLDRFRANCANRQAPTLSAVMKHSIKSSFPDEEKEYTMEWKRLWYVLSSICITSLWIQRNRVVFQQEQVTKESSVAEFWTTARRQLKAIAQRERSRPEKQEQGVRLRLCQAAMERQPREYPPQGMSPVQPPDLTKAPALLSRLRTYQTSSS